MLKRIPYFSALLVPALIGFLGLQWSWTTTISPTSARIFQAREITDQSEREISLPPIPEGIPPEWATQISPNSTLTIQLSSSHRIERITLQTNPDALYKILVTEDGKNFGRVLMPKQLSPYGMRTRVSPVLDPPVRAKEVHIVFEKNDKPNQVGAIKINVKTKKYPVGFLPLIVLFSLWTVLYAANYRLSLTKHVLDSWKKLDAHFALLLAAVMIPDLIVPIVCTFAFTILLNLIIRRLGGQKANGLWGKAAVGMVFVVFCSYTYLLTCGSGYFDVPENLSDAYDSLAENLVQGKSSVRPESIALEGFKIGSEVYTYFGPFPAFFRLGLNAVFPTWYGKWARFSCLAASFGALLALVTLLLWQLSRLTGLSLLQKRVLFLSSIAGFGMGSPILFLVSCGYIFHEAQLWGLCWALWALFFIFHWSDEKSRTSLTLIGVCSGFALLSRVPYGIALYLALGVITLIIVRAEFSSSHTISGKRLAACLASHILILTPALLMLGYQMWYNNDRFGSPLRFVDLDYYLLKGGDIERLVSTYGLFNFKRLVNSVPLYFGFGLDYFQSTAPYITVSRPDYLYPAMQMRYREWVLPLTIGSPWLIFSALVGTTLLLTRKTSLLLKAIGCALLVQFVLVLSHHFVTQRYTADFLPFLVFSTIIFMRWLSEVGHRAALRTSMIAVFVFTVIVGVTASSMSTISWQTTFNVWGGDKQYKNELRDLYAAMDKVKRRILSQEKRGTS